MSWPHYKPTVTVVDVLESGACYAGVTDWVKKHNRKIAGSPADHADQPEIMLAACADGNGDGDGDGNGDGNGYGYSYGYSYSNGDGDGDGNGYGYGYGYGDGNGYGEQE